jgi:hypothetical protein
MAVGVLLLAFMLVSPAWAASAKPVLSVADYKVMPYVTVSAQASPGPLMPGDSGIVVVTIANTLKAAAATNTTVHSDAITSNYFDGTRQTPGAVQTTSDQKTSTEASAGSATISSVSLAADGPVQVLTGPYTDTGMLGAGDSARFEFGIRAEGGAVDGTYQLMLRVKTPDDDIYLNYPIRVQVDSTEPMLILSKYAGAFNTTENEMSLDVANPRKAAIEAVSIKASGDEFLFEPQEYFVGTLNAGDTYTADFRVDSRGDAYTTTPQFTMVYRNGDNWHQTAPVAAAAHAPRKAYWDLWWETWWPYLALGLLCLLVLVIIVRVIMPKLKEKKGH